MPRELRLLLLLSFGFAVFYFLPVESDRFQAAVFEALALSRWYAREHVLLCLIPAFFIAGAIAVFIQRDAVMTYFGATAPKWLAYSVASVSGAILSVCSCTVLPLFGSIYKRGAGLGPAVAFLYSGPAINVLAIILTARILGPALGIARAVGAIAFCVVIGLSMHRLFRGERSAALDQEEMITIGARGAQRPLWQTALFFFLMVAILIVANWTPPDQPTGAWHAIYRLKWWGTLFFGAALWGVLRWFFNLPSGKLLLAALPAALLAWWVPDYPAAAFLAAVAGLTALMFGGPAELTEWRNQTWRFAKQIMPLLLLGVLIAGFLLGGVEQHDAGLIPSHWIEALLGDSPDTLLTMLGATEAPSRLLARCWPLWSNFFAACAGALMYFATLTEVPILRGLLDSGMGQGPALALLLAGPSLSLPNLLVINAILGPRKTCAYAALVVIMATLSGLLFGWWMP